MGLSRDFDSVTIEDGGRSIRVEATTSNEGGKPTTDPATDMYIMLIGGGHTVTAKPEVFPIPDPTWSVFFPDAGPKFADLDDVLCVGVAVSEDGPPEAWSELRQIVTKA